MSSDRIFGISQWSRPSGRQTPSEPRSTEPLRRSPSVPSFRKRFDWAWIRARVAARGIPSADIDDVAQEVVIAMSEAEPRLVVPPGKTEIEVRRAILWTIIRRRVAKFWIERAGQPVEVGPESEPSHVTAPSPEEQALTLGRALLLDDALAELEHKRPDAYAVLVAYELQGESMGTVAARLGIAESTGWTRLRAGRQALMNIARRRRAAETR